MKNKLKPISNDLVLERLRYENPWWITGQIEAEFNTMRRRLYFDLFAYLVEEVDVKRAVVLMGPRRVGKTVMMHHAIEKLLFDKKAISKKICFINIENPLYLDIGLEQLFSLARTAVGSDDASGWYVFFDEIQYLKDWEVHLKVLVDSYPNTKFIVSGSAAAALKLKSNESGAGRFTDFMLPPLTFHEYIVLKDYDRLIKTEKIDWDGKKLKILSTHDIKEMNKHFVDYINFGGYPEVIFNQKMQSNPQRYIKSDIIDKVLLRDLPSLYGIRDVQELNAFFTRLAYYSGNEITLSTLSNSSSVNADTLRKYIEYLEAAFLIKQIHRIDDNAKKFKRTTTYKIYLTNPSLRSALFSPLTAKDDMFGHMVETAVYAQWLHRDGAMPYYANWSKGEIDIVFLDEKKLKPLAVVEIKWSNRCYDDEKEIRHIISFCKNHKIKSAVVTTVDIKDMKIIDGVNVHFIPSSVYALTVGYNTIIQKTIN